MRLMLVVIGLMICSIISLPFLPIANAQIGSGTSLQAYAR